MKPPWHCTACRRLMAWFPHSRTYRVRCAGTSELCAGCRTRLAGAQPIDPIVVERLIRGDLYGKARPVEKRIAAAVLIRHGLNTRELAERMRFTERTATRYRGDPRVIALVNAPISRGAAA